MRWLARTTADSSMLSLHGILKSRPTTEQKESKPAVTDQAQMLRGKAGDIAELNKIFELPDTR
jgi:hypothetical protein